MTLRTLLISAAAITPLLSCSIKEVRSGCPCRLAVDISDASGEYNCVTISAEDMDKNTLHTENTSLAKTKVHRLEVPRTDIRVVCMQGLDRCSSDGRNVFIPLGNESDRIMSGYDCADCHGETAECKIKFHKDWSELTIVYASPGEASYPYKISVSGMINGFDAGTRTPSEGPFKCDAIDTADESNSVHLYLPRQKPSGTGLTMTLSGRDDNSAIKSYDLSNLITETGFDWTAEDLDDIRIGIDYSGVITYMTVIDWSTGMEMTIVI